MGSGDRRSRKGKIWRGSYGKSRPKHITVKNKFVKPVTEKPKEKAK